MAKKTDIRSRVYIDNSDVGPGLAATEGMLGDFAGKGGLLLAGAGATGAAAFGKGFLDGMSEQQLAAKFGDQIVNDSADIYRKVWGDSIEDVAMQMRDVQAGLGDVGNIETMTEAAFILGEKFDVDVGSTIQDVTELAESFGLQGEAAFDLWGTALEGMTTEGRAELSAATREYGTFFADMGISAEETLGLFVGFGAGGALELDKMGDAMKELTIRGTDMSAASGVAFEIMGKDQALYADMLLEGGDAGRAAMMELVQGLSGIEDPAKQAEAAIALFGAPMEDLGTAQIPEVLEQLRGMSEGLEVTKGGVAAMGAEMSDNLATTLEGIKRQGLGALADLMEGRVIPVAENVVATFMHRWPEIKATVLSVTTAVGDVVAEYWPGVKATIVDVATAIGGAVQEYWPTIQEIIQAVSSTVVDVVQEYWPKVSAIITEVIDTVQAMIETGTAAVSYIWERWGEDITETVQRAWVLIEGIVSTALDLVRDIFATFKALFQGDWSAMWDGIKAVVDGALSLIVNAMGLVWEGVRLAAIVAWDLIKDEVWNAVKAMPGLLLDGAVALAFGAKTLFTHAKNGIMEALGTAAIAVVDWVLGIPGLMLDAAVDLYQTGLDWFTALGDGIEAALIGLPGVLLDTVLGPLEDIYNAVLGIIGLGNDAGKDIGSLPSGGGDTAQTPENGFIDDQPLLDAVIAAGGGGTAKSINLGQADVAAILSPSGVTPSGGGGGRGGGLNIEHITVMDGRDFAQEVNELEVVHGLRGYGE